MTLDAQDLAQRIDKIITNPNVNESAKFELTALANWVDAHIAREQRIYTQFSGAGLKQIYLDERGRVPFVHCIFYDSFGDMSMLLARSFVAAWDELAQQLWMQVALPSRLGKDEDWAIDFERDKIAGGFARILGLPLYCYETIDWRKKHEPLPAVIKRGFTPEEWVKRVNMDPSFLMSKEEEGRLDQLLLQQKKGA